MLLAVSHNKAELYTVGAGVVATSSVSVTFNNYAQY